MRYVFLGLMCAFAIAYTAVKLKGSLAARLTLKSIASMSFVLIAFAARLDASEPYFALIITGLCLSLSGDVLLVLPGTAALATGGSIFLLAHLSFIAAFFVYAALSWVDVALLIAFVALGAVIFLRKTKGLGRLKPLVCIYAVVLCAMAAKAVSMLFVEGLSPLYAGFAALGGVLTALSDVALGYARIGRGERKGAGAFATLSYYAAQALLALSVVL